MGRATKTKSKATSATSSPQTKKWKWTPGSGSISHSPSRSKQREMCFDLVRTCVGGLYIGFCTKSWDPNEAAFLFPMEKGLNDKIDGKEHAKNWKYVYSFLPRRDTDVDDGTTSMKTKKGSQYDWKVVLLLIDEADTSPEEAGRHVAHCFTKFTRNKDVMGSPEKYSFKKCFATDPQPLNHYLLDLDVAKVLKSLFCHEDSEYKSKQDVLEDNELMEAFFGSTEVGREFLEDMEEEDWDFLDVEN